MGRVLQYVHTYINMAVDMSCMMNVLLAPFARHYLLRLGCSMRLSVRLHVFMLPFEEQSNFVSPFGGNIEYRRELFWRQNKRANYFASFQCNRSVNIRTDPFQPCWRLRTRARHIHLCILRGNCFRFVMYIISVRAHGESHFDALACGKNYASYGIDYGSYRPWFNLHW